MVNWRIYGPRPSGRLGLTLFLSRVPSLGGSGCWHGIGADCCPVPCRRRPLRSSPSSADFPVPPVAADSPLDETVVSLCTEVGSRFFRSQYTLMESQQHIPPRRFPAVLARDKDDSSHSALRGTSVDRVFPPSALRFWVGLVVFFLSSLAMRSDVPVWFGNRELSPPRLVHEAYTGRPLVRTSQQMPVAQLLYAIPTNYPPVWRAAGSIAYFSLESSPNPGTWDSAERFLPGVEIGQHVVLSVLVWDRRKASNWERVLNDPIPVSGWQSEAFDYVYHSGPASAQWMTNFPGGTLWGDSCLFSPPPPAGEQFCDENSTVLLFPRERVNWPGDLSLHLLESAVVNYPAGLRLGSLSVMGQWETGIRYTPRPNTYGEDWLYQYRQGGFCDPPLSTATVLRLIIRPDPRRPYLVPSQDGDRLWLHLRGLADRRYRLESSADLDEWVEVIRVTGNNSEVDVSAALLLSDRSRFYRIVDLSP